MSIKTYEQAIKDVTAEEMRRDKRVFVMGEDVAEMGGLFGCTRGLLDEFGAARVRNTPISEAGFISAAVGAACAGMRPIAELMYMDFSFVAMDSICNQAAKTRYIFGGKATVPMVIRGQQGIGRATAATHSQSLESLFMNVPGLKIVCASTPADAAGLLRTAIRDDNPVMMFEHKAFYKTSGEVPDDPEFAIPFGKCDIKRPGKDVTIVSNLLYVSKSLEAAQELERQGVDAEVIDIRSMCPLDYDTIVESVKKTGRLIVVHEAHTIAGWGAEVVAEVVRRAFDYLAAAPVRIGTKHCPLPFNLGLENAAVPQIKDIIEEAIKLVRG